MRITDIEITELRNVDPGDISDVLIKIERSFGFKFGRTELNEVSNFGELCDLITNKAEGSDTSDCTTQQGFYKLRNSISEALLINRSFITPNTNLKDLFPKSKRIQHVVAVENKLGFKVDVLRPKDWIINVFALILLCSIIILFINWKIGLGSLTVSIIALKLASKFGKQMEEQSLGELAKKISQENYMHARRNSSTINKTEIASKVKELFSRYLALEESFLGRESTFD